LDLKGFIGILQDADGTQTAKETNEKLGISVRRYTMFETGTGSRMWSGSESISTDEALKMYNLQIG
jgi:hypothetical protein